jgi:hypothetical protein
MQHICVCVVYQWGAHVHFRNPLCVVEWLYGVKLDACMHNKNKIEISKRAGGALLASDESFWRETKYKENVWAALRNIFGCELSHFIIFSYAYGRIWEPLDLFSNCFSLSVI